jgi:hypothetical protein
MLAFALATRDGWKKHATHVRKPRVGALGTVPMGPHSSMGSPMTFIIRPRVARPTGICVWVGKERGIGFAFWLVFAGDRSRAGMAHRRERPVPLICTYRNRASRVHHVLSANQTFGGVHGNRADGVLAEVLRNLEHQPDVVAFHCGDKAGWGWSECVWDARQASVWGPNTRCAIVPGFARVPSRADMMAGSSPSNCTSTTAPITWVTLPLAAFAAAAAANPRAEETPGLIPLAMEVLCTWPTGENFRPARETPTAADRSACLDRLPALREKRLMMEAGTEVSTERCVRDHNCAWRAG